MSSSRTVTGAAELQRLLRTLEPRVGKRVIRQSLREGAKMVQAEAKRQAPVLEDTRTLGSQSQGRVPGTLRRGIVVRSMKSNKPSKGRFRIGVMMAKREKLDIDGGSKWFYPAIVHAGHSTARARPFMRNAVDSLRRSVDARIERRLRVGILS